jgi:primosomal protein N' (replication factor Y)
VEIGPDQEREGLKPIQSVSGDHPVFGPSMLPSLEWAAHHYLAPLSVILDRTAPPNLPKRIELLDFEPVPEPGGEDELASLSRLIANGAGPTLTAVVTRSHTGWPAALAPILSRDMSVMIVVATAAEAERLHAVISSTFGSRALLSAGGNDGAITTAWTESRRPGSLLLGTPRIASWEMPGLALAVVLEEGRRAMKDRQTPTLHVRDLLLERSRLEGFSLCLLGPTPSVEVLAARADVVRSGPRAWSLVEVVDRRQEPPGSGHLAEPTIAAIRGGLANGWRTLVFTHRRLGDESMRCTTCRAVRACPRCGSRMSREPRCRRCGLESQKCRTCGGIQFEAMGTVPERLVASLSQSLGSGKAGGVDEETPVSVGTERDLAGSDRYDLVVVADTDGLTLGHNYRAEEEALRILARLGNRVEPGHGRRLILQTSMPDSPVVATMKRGDPIPYLESILAKRFKDRLPPAGEMIAIELRGEDAPPEEPHRELVGAGGTVLGPATIEDGHRWLVQGDLDEVRPRLRQVVARWRERGWTVRVDVDPIDL